MKPEVREKLKLLKQTDQDTKTCIFCGGSPTTDEHVFSGWTHKYMLARQLVTLESVTMPKWAKPSAQ